MNGEPDDIPRPASRFATAIAEEPGPLAPASRVRLRDWFRKISNPKFLPLRVAEETERALLRAWRPDGTQEASL
jgi:hypothetical protein